MVNCALLIDFKGAPVMARKRILKTRLFGYRKSDVRAYLQELDAKAEEQISERDEKIESLNKLYDEIAILQAKVSDYEQRESKIASERELIAQTLVAAKETANKLVADAQVEVAKKRAEFQQTYTMEINKLASIRNEVVQLRRFATDAIRSFERELTTLERTTIE